MLDRAQLDRRQLDREIEQNAARAVELLSRLVEQPSTVGQEAGAQEVLAAELDAAGFAVERLEIPDDIGADPLAGVPRAPYAGRYDIVARRGPAQGRSLLINGHMDVVPADDATPWSSPPFSPVIVDGWLHGRGAGDMKSGFAAGMLAIWALDSAAPNWLTGPLTIVSAIEEEYTGNGTLAAARAGHLADAAILLEPTELDILLAGIGIVWVGIEVDGRAAHAESAGMAINPILAARPVIDALLDFERRTNADRADEADPAFAGLDHPYNVNIGTFDAGDWSSSVPAIARLGVRVGHPRGWTSEQAIERVREHVLAAVAGDPWLAEHPPRFALNGFRAEGYAQDPDTAIVRAIAAAHAEVHGSEPARVSLGSTTDARFYVNRFGTPAAAYGPRTRNIHGTDEAVELDSIVQVAKAVARLLHDWYAE